MHRSLRHQGIRQVRTRPTKQEIPMQLATVQPTVVHRGRLVTRRKQAPIQPAMVHTGLVHR